MPLWLEDLIAEAGMYSVLVQLFFVNEFTLCRREAIPYALFSPHCCPPNRNYYVDFYIAVDFSLRGWGVLSPRLFLSCSFTILRCCWFIDFGGCFVAVVVLVFLFLTKKEKSNN